MPFYIRKYSTKTHKKQIEDAVLNSLMYVSENSKRFRTPSYVVMNDLNLNVTFHSSNQIYDDAFFTLQLIRDHIDDSVSVISIEDGAVPIVRVNISNKTGTSNTRGVIVDMSGIMSELRSSSDLKFRQQLSWMSFLFFVVGFVMFIVSLPDTQLTINEAYIYFMNFVNSMISKYIQPPQIQPSITFKLF